MALQRLSEWTHPDVKPLEEDLVEVMFLSEGGILYTHGTCSMDTGKFLVNCRYEVPNVLVWRYV